MMLFRNDPLSTRIKPILLGLILVVLAQGCAPAPTPTAVIPEQTLQPPSPSSTPSPDPTVTPTLALIDGGLSYLAVGLPPYQSLSIYADPSPG